MNTARNIGLAASIATGLFVVASPAVATDLMNPGGVGVGVAGSRVLAEASGCLATAGNLDVPPIQEVEFVVPAGHVASNWRAATVSAFYMRQRWAHLDAMNRQCIGRLPQPLRCSPRCSPLRSAGS